MPLLPSAKGVTNENSLVITNQRAGERARTHARAHTHIRLENKYNLYKYSLK